MVSINSSVISAVLGSGFGSYVEYIHLMRLKFWCNSVYIYFFQLDFDHCSEFLIQVCCLERSI